MSAKLDRTGETKMMNCGLVASIIAYRNNRDIDVQFSNGGLVQHRSYSNFKDGKICCPIIIEQVNGYARVSNPNTGAAWLMDIEDLPILGGHKWHESLGYIKSDTRAKSTILHRAIMSAPPDMQIDHINGIRTDNRKQNLRVCTNAENSRNRGKMGRNTSGYKGVYWHKRAGKWVSYIKFNGKQRNLGLFMDERDAAKAYNAAAVKYFGDFACLNDVG